MRCTSANFEFSYRLRDQISTSFGIETGRWLEYTYAETVASSSKVGFRLDMATALLEGCEWNDLKLDPRSAEDVLQSYGRLANACGQ